ncbi:MAG: Dps family protein [Bacilli bacterium]
MNTQSLAQLSGLDPEYAAQVSRLLNVYLANLHVTYMKLRNFHWNVTSINFLDFHKQLEKMYDQVADEIDFIAERIKMLGHYPLGSLNEMVEQATLKELPSQDYTPDFIAGAIIEDFSETARFLRELARRIKDSGDEYLINHLAESLGFLEKNIWFFDAYLKNNPLISNR